MKVLKQYFQSQLMWQQVLWETSELNLTVGAPSPSVGREDLKGKRTWQRNSQTRLLATHCDKRMDMEVIKTASQKLCECVRITQKGQSRSQDWQTGGVHNCPWSLESLFLFQGTQYQQGPLFQATAGCPFYSQHFALLLLFPAFCFSLSLWVFSWTLLCRKHVCLGRGEQVLLP